MKTTILKTISKTAGKTAHRVVLKAKKHSPEILMVTGGISIIAGVIFACKETLKVEEILDKHKETEETISDVLSEKPYDYSQKDAAHDMLVLRARTGAAFIKNYAPAAGCLALGFGCFFAAHGIMKKRNVALMAAYKAVDTAFKDYRCRVKRDLGSDWDKHFMFDTEMENSKCKCGKDKKVPVPEDKDPKIESVQPSIYAKWFDEASPYWRKDALLNREFLICQQNYANDLLRSRGHLFLNDVYRMLGLPDTKAGAVVGWVQGPGHRDTYVDFGLYKAQHPGVVDFMEGWERSVMLDFNVDGVIYDLI